MIGPRIEELLKAHHRLIRDCNIASLKVKLLLPTDIELDEIEPHIVGNLCVSLRESDLVNKLAEMQRAHNKYKQYSNFQPRETVISYTLYAKLRDKGIYVKRVFK